MPILDQSRCWPQISVNRDYYTALHIDRASLGPSWIVGLGEYTGKACGARHAVPLCTGPC